MKNLNSFKGVTLNTEELRKVEGGSPWINRAWNWIKRHLYPYEGPGIGLNFKFNI